MILLSDANVLIDFGYVGAVALLPEIAPVEVLDVVLEECRHEHQPTLVSDIVECGIVVVETDLEIERGSRALRTDQLSMEDGMNLYYASTRKRVLLAGDLPLRTRASEVGVEVHGSIWLVDRIVERGLADPDDVCRWLERWPVVGRRLPSTELHRVRRMLGCD